MRNVNLFATVVFIGAGALSASALESTWTGRGSDNRWTNSGNWSNGVPGLRTDGTGAKGDKAVFSSVEEGAATTIDLAGLKSIGTLVVTGASAPKYTFGTSGDQLLGLEKAGASAYSAAGRGLHVESDVVSAPVVVATLSLTDATMRNSDYFFVANHSSDTMTVGDFGSPQGANVDGQYFALAGSGPFLVTGSAVGSPAVTYDYVALAVFGAGRVTFRNATGAATARFVKVSGDGNHEICIPAGMKWQTVDGKFDFQTEGSTRIWGDGCISVFGGANCYFQNTRYGMVSVEVPLVSSRTSETRLYTFYGNGTIALESCANNIKGPVALQGSLVDARYPLTLAVKALGGAADLPSSIGKTADPILFAANGVVRYTGVGETSPRGFRFAKKIGSYAYDGLMTLENAGTGPWTLTGVIDAESGAAATELVLKGDSAFPATLSAAIADFQSGVPLAVTKEGTGTWKLAGECTNTGATQVNSGTLELADGVSSVSPLTLAAGASLKVSPSATVSLGTVSVGGAAVLELGAGASLTIAEMSADDYAKLKVVARPGSSLVMNGSPVELDRGMIEVKDGETRTETFVLGPTSAANGTLYQTGGNLELNIPDSQGSFPCVGYGGFWSMDGGSFVQSGAGSVILSLYSSGVATYRQTAGTASVRQLGIGWGSNTDQIGEVLVSGGSLEVREMLCVPGFRYAAVQGAATRTTGSVTIEGDGNMASPVNRFLGSSGKGVTVSLNLNGGTFTTGQIERHPGTDDSNRLFVNFNGGVLKFTNATNYPFGTVRTMPSRITVFAGGATLDLARTGYFPAFFRKPEGRGVASIPLPTAPVASYLITQPPVITITDGENGPGYGASAVCDWDWATCSYSAPRITCPGCNYTNPVATFDFGYFNNVHQTVTVPCVLTDLAPTSGGLVKRGTGTLTMFGGDEPGSNDFGGPLVIEQGQVRLYNNALADGQTVVLKGGDLAIATGATAPALRWRFTLGEPVSAPNMDVQFPAGSTVTFEGTIDQEANEYVLATFKSISGVPTLTNALPEGWKFKVGGGRIVLKKTTGIVLIVR